MDDFALGHEQIVKPAQIARPSNLRMTFLYVVQAGPYCKVGITVDLRQRMTSYATHCPLETTCVALFEVRNGFAASVESEVHRLLEPYWVKGEWFAVEARQVLEAIEAARSSGIPLRGSQRAYPYIEPAAQKAAHPRKAS